MSALDEMHLGVRGLRDGRRCRDDRRYFRFDALGLTQSGQHGNEEKIRREDREAMNTGDEGQGEKEGPTHRWRLYHEWAGDVRLKIARVKQLVQ